MNKLLSENDAKAVTDILVEQLGVQPDQLTPEARLQQDLGADSLTIIEITLALEERFHVAIPDEMSEHVSTVGDIFDLLADFLVNSTKSPGNKV